MESPYSKWPGIHPVDKPGIFTSLPFLLIARTGGYLLLPLVLLLLPAIFFDSGTSLCLSQLLAAQACPGCGMTRALMHLIHLDLAGAARFNKLCFIVFPVISFLWLKWFFRDVQHIKQWWALNRAQKKEL